MDAGKDDGILSDKQPLPDRLVKIFMGFSAIIIFWCATVIHISSWTLHALRHITTSGVVKPLPLTHRLLMFHRVVGIQ